MQTLQLLGLKKIMSNDELQEFYSLPSIVKMNNL